MNLPGQKTKTALKCLLILCFAGAGLTANGQIYKHVDEDGKITFTDKPPPNATPVEIKPVNTTPPPSPRAYPKATPKSDDDAASIDYTVSISSPANETIVAPGPGNFSVYASLEPGLSSAHTLQLLIDGSPHGETQRSTSWALTNIFRGEHNLEVAVLDAKGKQLIKSDGITVFVFRPSSHKKKNRLTPR
jgi:hypothetical protein